MPQIPQGKDAAQKDPAALKTHLFREITGVYTAASRNAIPDDKVSNLENVIPIGSQNAVVTDGASYAGVNYGADTIYYAESANLNGNEYIVCFAQSGNAYLFDTALNQAKTINPPSLQFAGFGTRMDQWGNSIILFIDHTGYYSYDGTTFKQITGPGIPLGGDDIAVYSGRVWIAKGRILFTSGAGDYTAPSWLPQNGASFNVLIDPQIRSTIQGMTVANGILYIFSESGINAIYNVTVPMGSVPPTPIYTNQNIQPFIGTDQPASITPFNQATLFANKYGVYQLYGVTAPKISDDIDGTWRDVDFSQQISGGQVIVEGILCGAFLIKRYTGNSPVLAMWFQKDGRNSWWFANFGTVTFIVSAIVGGIATLYGFIGNQVFRLFSSISSPGTAIVETKLWPLEDDLAQKEAVRVGFLSFIETIGSAINLSVDGLNSSVDSEVTSALQSGLWVGDLLDVGQWETLIAGIPVPITGGWFAPSYALTSGRAPAMYSHNLGLTLTCTGYKLKLNLMAIDYKLRDRWQQ